MKKQEGDWKLMIVSQDGTSGAGTLKSYDAAFGHALLIKQRDLLGKITAFVVITPNGEEITLVL